MPTIHDLCEYLESYAPLRLAEDWDNVGLLVGRRDREVTRIMTALTVTPTTASEAVAEGAELIVTHHPVPFRPVSRITDDTTVGHLLLRLIGHQIAIYSPHTAFDSAAQGINQQMADRLGIRQPQPLIPDSDEAGLGSGRYGSLASPARLSEVADHVRARLELEHLRIVGDPDRRVGTVAVACGSAGEFLETARQVGCDLLITGETSFHTCLEAEATEVALLLVGHFASERFAVQSLAIDLAQRFPEARVWASRRESDPLRWI
jgi:dinuclear metal center YbgI/SA1388 family protein